MHPGVFITEIDSVNTIEFFHKNNYSSYISKLQFSQNIVRITSTDTFVVNTLNHDLGIIISKNKKQFGDNFQDVWEVNLGEIRD